jgi:hypothetical protein
MYTSARHTAAPNGRNKMTTFFVIGQKHVNSNTGEHGFGDYPESKQYIRLRVEADTKRKAMNAAKKIDSSVYFGGMFGLEVLETSEVIDRPWIDRNGCTL